MNLGGRRPWKRNSLWQTAKGITGFNRNIIEALADTKRAGWVAPASGYDAYRAGSSARSLLGLLQGRLPERWEQVAPRPNRAPEERYWLQKADCASVHRTSGIPALDCAMLLKLCGP